MIPINLPQIGEEEVEAVVEVLKSGKLTHGLGEGPRVKKFEKAFAKFAEAKHAVAVNTGTAALHSAVVGTGLNKDFEVILPSFTFVATAEAVILAGGKPVFVDIDPKTYNISSTEIEKAITKRTEAIMPVDLYGLPADMKCIREIADQNDLLIIEDAAQAHGAIYNRKPVGKMADATCWSFYASKNITTGEGGMVTTDSNQIAKKIRLFRTHGEKAKYASRMFGHNYRMSEIQAAIGCVQLGKLSGFLTKRRENVRRLMDLLQKTKRLELPIEPPDRRHSWYLFTVRLERATEQERNRVVRELREKGIGSTIYYSNPIHLMPYYRDVLGTSELPETEKASKQVFSLPVHPGVTEEQVTHIANSLLSIL
ncbi:DegT/DnrJ/EryC1/StrS family aminotransferase [Candidatus Bathyarchaeota archaeon]|nr:DegT/DnrJ/EryC1/StrS family aminotransferase [Candidatus Bathyarchaeota archaeon]